MKLKQKLAKDYAAFLSDDFGHSRVAQQAFVAGFEIARVMANQGFIDMLDGGSFGTNDILKMGEEEMEE